MGSFLFLTNIDLLETNLSKQIPTGFRMPLDKHIFISTYLVS